MFFFILFSNQTTLVAISGTAVANCATLFNGKRAKFL